MSELIVKITQIVNEAVAIAQEENRRLGIANVYELNGKLIWQLPDGTFSTVPPK